MVAGVPNPECEQGERPAIGCNYCVGSASRGGHFSLWAVGRSRGTFTQCAGPVPAQLKPLVAPGPVPR